MSQKKVRTIFFFQGWGWLAFGVSAYTTVRYLSELSNISLLRWTAKLEGDYRALIYPIFDSLSIPSSYIMRDLITVYAVGAAAQFGNLLSLRNSRVPILPQVEKMPVIEYLELRIQAAYVFFWPIVVPTDIFLKILTGKPLAVYIAKRHPRGSTRETLDQLASLRSTVIAFFRYFLIGLVIVVTFTVVNGGCSR
jgi:hypothetical protein